MFGMHVNHMFSASNVIRGHTAYERWIIECEMVHWSHRLQSLAKESNVCGPRSELALMQHTDGALPLQRVLIVQMHQF